MLRGGGRECEGAERQRDQGRLQHLQAQHAEPGVPACTGNLYSTILTKVQVILN